jgi:OmpA-OmpF porin, OOP family
MLRGMRIESIRAAIVIAAAALLGFAGAASAQKILERGKYGDPDALATIDFDFGHADLSDRAKAQLDGVAAHLEKGALEVVGHTDFTGDPAYNQWLSGQRAQAVRNYLIERGVPPDRVTIVAAGEDQPVDSNHSKIGRARNRRVDVKPAK